VPSVHARIASLVSLAMTACGGGEPNAIDAARRDAGRAAGPRPDTGGLDASSDGGAAEDAPRLDGLDGDVVLDARTLDAGPPDAYGPTPADADLDAPLPSSVALAAQCTSSQTLAEGCGAYCAGTGTLSDESESAGAILWARLEDAMRVPSRVCLYEPVGLDVDRSEVTSACSVTFSAGACLRRARCVCTP
jgi:hypothetical protein